MVTRTTLAFSVTVLMATFGASGCRKEPATTPSMTPKASATAGTASAPVALPAEIVARLAKADALDGATDHVVSQCAMCALRMPGSDAHETKMGDYALHFCSDDCKNSFDEDATKAVLALKVNN